MIVARTIRGRASRLPRARTAGTGKPSRRAKSSIARWPSSRRSSCLDRGLEPEPADRHAGGPAGHTTGRSQAPPAYKAGELSRRVRHGSLAKLGEADSRGGADADVKNSTFSDKFEKNAPDRFYQNFIAEQIMLGSAMGLAARGAIPFPSTFACFLTRAADFVRMAAISNVPIKMAGSHAGVSIGEDGPSQMALEDLAMCRAQPNFAVLYPCDAVSTERLVASWRLLPVLLYMRTSRPKTEVIHSADDEFSIGAEGSSRKR